MVYCNSLNKALVEFSQLKASKSCKENSVYPGLCEGLRERRVPAGLKQLTVMDEASQQLHKVSVTPQFLTVD